MTHPEQPSTEPQNEELQENKYLRRIRSFVLREGRLTKGQQRSLDLFWPTMGLEYQTTPYDMTSCVWPRSRLSAGNWFWYGQIFGANGQSCA